MSNEKAALAAANQGKLATTNTHVKSGSLVRSTADIVQLATLLNGGDRNQTSLALIAQKIMYGLDIGIGIGAAVAGIHIVKDKPTVGSGIMAAAIKGSDKYDFSIVECTKTKCKLQFYEHGNQVGMIEVEIGDFSQLKSKDVWRNYPDDMLFARAISKGMRRYCPDVFGMTVYVEGELDDQPRETINITAAATMDAEPEPEFNPDGVVRDMLTIACEERNQSRVSEILTQIKESHPAHHAKLRAYAGREWKKHEPKPVQPDATEPAKPAQSDSIEEAITAAVRSGQMDLINTWRKEAEAAGSIEQFNECVAKAEEAFKAELASEETP